MYDGNWRGVNVLKVDNLIYQSNKTMISFKSAGSKALEMDKCVSELEDVYLHQFSDIFGKNFVKKFLTPWESFLSKYGVKITCSKDSLIIPANDFIMKDRRVENAVAVELVDKNNHNIIYNPSGWQGIREPIKGATSNDATVNLLYCLIHNKMKMNDNSIGFPNPLQRVEVPEKLKQITDEVAMVLNGFKANWNFSVDDTSDKGGKFLKQVLIRLMPEGQIKKTTKKSLQVNA